MRKKWKSLLFISQTHLINMSLKLFQRQIIFETIKLMTFGKEESKVCISHSLATH